MDTIFNLELLRSVYVFKDLNSSIKDVNTSLEKTTSSIRSLSDSFSSFTKSSVEKVKELSSEFKELTKSIAAPQVVTISFDSSGAMNEFSKISSMAQNFSELSYKETLTQSTKIGRPNSAEGKGEDKEESVFGKIIEVVTKLGEVSEAIGNVWDLIERFTGKGRDSASGSGGGGELVPALGEGIGGLIQRALPKLRTVFTAIRTGLSGVMASIGEVGAALLAIPGVGEVLLVVAAVVALVIAIKQLWEHSKRFREMIGYIEGAGKAVFHNLGIYATRLWELAIKPLIDKTVSGFSALFSFIGAVAKAAWSGIVLAVKTAVSTISTTAQGAWSGFVLAFNIAVSTLKAIWNGFVTGFKIAVSAITTSAKAAWSGFVQAFNIVVSSLKSIWNGFVTGFKIAISAIVTSAKAAWSGIVQSFNLVISGFRTAFSSVINLARGLWAGITAVFRNIGIAFKAVGTAIVSSFRVVFSVIRGLIDAVWSGIVLVFNSVWKFIVSLFKSVVMVFKAIWSTIISVFKGIWNVIVGVWSGMTEIFSKFKAWIYDAILNPIIETFSGVWAWITDLIDKIINRLSSLFEPVKRLLKQIFSSEGTVNINEAGEKGAKGRGDEFEADKLRDKIKKDGKESGGKSKSGDAFGGDIFNSKYERQLDFKNFGASALSNVQSRNSAFGGKGSMSGGSGMGGQKSVGNLNITKLIENMNIYNQNNTMSKDAIIQMVREALLTAVADFTLAQKDTY
ncbi:hypothetical protein [Chryseobacterium sp. YR221]|uniref:phage tail protein n=1 Tax=Chryseobacterium sp. YR221 TaxID=1500293 RepID=UPI0009D894CE|nr:hypothetical protein [Chryseobacterium sp. YR221]SMC75389.1 Phage-related protein [Chryseobacterium sp. YR221]